MWNTEIKPKINKADVLTPFFLGRGFLMGFGIVSLIGAFLVLGFSLYEAFFGGGKIQAIRLPGFQEVKLETPGLYAGLYQHRGTGPLPIKALTQMDIRVMSKDDYEEVPVLMNGGGQSFERLGFRGLAVFNFAISKPGDYTISGISTGQENSPTVSIMLVPQSAGNIKQTLFVGVAFFVFFLSIGILVLLRMERWTKKSVS